MGHHKLNNLRVLSYFVPHRFSSFCSVLATRSRLQCLWGFLLATTRLLVGKSRWQCLRSLATGWRSRIQKPFAPQKSISIGFTENHENRLIFYTKINFKNWKKNTENYAVFLKTE
jgi:hypothetical protein